LIFTTQEHDVTATCTPAELATMTGWFPVLCGLFLHRTGFYPKKKLTKLLHIPVLHIFSVDGNENDSASDSTYKLHDEHEDSEMIQ